MKKRTPKAAPLVQKDELVHQIASRANTTLKEVQKVLAAFTEVVTEDVAKGNRVQLMGFGTWELRHVSERNFKPINSPELATLPAGKRVGFQVGAVLAKAAK